MSTDTARFRAADGVHVRRVGEELVVLDLTGGQYYALDAVGAAIWDELTRGRTVAQTVDTLMTLYAVTRDQLTGDVRRLIEALEARGLLARIY